MDVMLDRHGRLVALGYPDAEYVTLVERREDFNDLLHTLPQSIRSEAIRSLLQVVCEMNAKRVWTDGDFSLANLIATLSAQSAGLG